MIPHLHIIFRSFSYHFNICNGQSFTMDSAVDKVRDHGHFLFVVCEVVEENARGVD